MIYWAIKASYLENRQRNWERNSNRR